MRLGLEVTAGKEAPGAVHKNEQHEGICNRPLPILDCSPLRHLPFASGEVRPPIADPPRWWEQPWPQSFRFSQKILHITCGLFKGSPAGCREGPDRLAAEAFIHYWWGTAWKLQTSHCFPIEAWAPSVGGSGLTPSSPDWRGHPHYPHILCSFLGGRTL